jgi:hypothetical protein
LEHTETKRIKLKYNNIPMHLLSMNS